MDNFATLKLYTALYYIAKPCHFYYWRRRWITCLGTDYHQEGFSNPDLHQEETPIRIRIKMETVIRIRIKVETLIWIRVKMGALFGAALGWKIWSGSASRWKRWSGSASRWELCSGSAMRWNNMIRIRNNMETLAQVRIKMFKNSYPDPHQDGNYLQTYVHSTLVQVCSYSEDYGNEKYFNFVSERYSNCCWYCTWMVYFSYYRYGVPTIFHAGSQLVL